MLPFPHILLFVPLAVFALAFVTAFTVSSLASLTARRQTAKPRPLAASRPAPAYGSAQIIYFRPRKTSLPSGLSLGVR